MWSMHNKTSGSANETVEMKVNWTYTEEGPIPQENNLWVDPPTTTKDKVDEEDRGDGGKW